MNQEKIILKHLQRKSITSLEAINLYGITRLSARVYNLREVGINVLKRTKTVKNRQHKKVQVAEYYLKK